MSCEAQLSLRNLILAAVPSRSLNYNTPGCIPKMLRSMQEMFVLDVAAMLLFVKS